MKTSMPAPPPASAGPWVNGKEKGASRLGYLWVRRRGCDHNSRADMMQDGNKIASPVFSDGLGFQTGIRYTFVGGERFGDLGIGYSRHNRLILG